jgi:hypothetical protein
MAIDTSFLNGVTEEKKSEFFARLLQALWKGSVPQGLSGLGQVSSSVSWEAAAQQLAQNEYVDYYNGRVIKTRFTTTGLDSFLYNRDRGARAFEGILTGVRAEMNL